MWSDFENETLIHNHKLAKILKKRYQRASDFYSTLYNLLGTVSIILSIISSTFTWSSSFEKESQKNLLRIIISILTTSTLIQNFYNFQDISNNHNLSSKNYSKLQNKIESIGNIHPDYRTSKPDEIFQKIQCKINELNDNRKELSPSMIKIFYHKKEDEYSYLKEKHEKYKELKENEKLNYTHNVSLDIYSEEETERDIS